MAIENVTTGTGADTLIGNSANNVLNGGGGIDTANYSSATVGVSINLATGTASSTQTGTDTLVAIENVTTGTGADTLIGNAAANTFNGGGGNDNLNGGLGKDSLTGSTGVDKFIYKSIADSGVGSAARDVITDFQGGSGEKIDLSAIDAYSKKTGNQAFTYIGSNAFTGTKGEARFSGGVLQMNTGTDKTADMEIALTGVTTFSSNFLVL